MNKVTSLVMFLLVLVVASTAALGQQDTKQEVPPKQEPPKQEDPKELMAKASYLLGRNIATNFQRDGIALDVEALVKGMNEVAKGTDSSISDEDAQKVMIAFDKYARQLAEKKLAEMADKNMRDGEAFMKKNGTAEGVKQLESGLQIIVIKEGTGEKPKSTDFVKVEYKGTLVDGKVFDQTQKGSPATFAVNGVIKGFSEGLMNMKVGSKCKLFIPGPLAYGMRPPPRSMIGPNQTLIFEVELIGIVK